MKPDSHDDYYKFIGEALVHGTMEGEALSALDEDKLNGMKEIFRLM
jgi:hypothetical protein